MLNKNQSKRILLIGNALGQFGSGILSFVVGLHILQSMNSVFLYSVSQMVGPLVAMLLLPILGGAIDKFNKNKIIRISQFISAMAIGSFLFMGNGLVHGYVQILLLIIVLKISDQILVTTLTAATVNVVNVDEIQSFRSKIQLIQATSMILSPIIAVFIFDKFELIGVMFIELFIELLVVIMYWKINFQSTQNEDMTEEQTLLSLFKGGINFIFSYKKIIFGLVFVLMINFILGIVNVGLPFVQIKSLNLSNQAYALNDSILAVGLLLGSLIASKIKFKGTLNIARYAISVVALGTVVLGLFLTLNLSKGAWSFVFGGYYLILGLSITICNILMSSWSIIKIPTEFQGRVFAVLNAVTQVSLPLSMLLFGYIFDVVDSVLIFIISGAVLLLITLVVPSLFKINLCNDDLE